MSHHSRDNCKPQDAKDAFNAVIDCDPRRVQIFVDRLRQYEGRLIKSEQLWSLFGEVFPHRPRGTEGRQWVLDTLYTAEQQGVIKLPTPSGRRWDHSLDPPIPTSVTIIATKVKRDANWRIFPWHPSLSWVADLKMLSRDQEAFLLRVHKGLVEGIFQKQAPLKYRSIQLTGHEKRLGELVRTVLFEPGRLSFELLGCVPDILPLVLEKVGEQSIALVFENKDAFRTACSVLKRLPQSPYGLVGYGAGAGFERSVLHFKLIDQVIERIEYVGDMDRPGLRIAKAAAKVALAENLPLVVPARGLHRAMIESVRQFGHPGGMEYKGEEKKSSTNDGILVEWLPDNVRNEILAIIRAGKRIPEEILGPDEMLSVWSGTAE